jgi:hypothetical protein
VLVDNWRPGRKVESNQTGFWGAVSFPPVSIKDRSLLIPLLMLNACLTFSWPNKVPFDREASGMIRTGTHMGARTGAEGNNTGTRRVSPRCVLAVGRSLGTAALVYLATFTEICNSLDR